MASGRDPQDSTVAGAVAAEVLDLLSVEAREHLESFDEEARVEFADALEAAPTELQRELLHRALASRHSPVELRSFAEQIHDLDDEELYARVTLTDTAQDGSRRTVVQRMRAESDPVYGYLANGFVLEQEKPILPGRRRPTFTLPAEKSIPPGGKRNVRELGASAGPDSPKKAADSKRIDDSFGAATAALGISYREVRIDGAKLSLKKAVEMLVSALKRGYPVPASLTSLNGGPRKYVLFLQATPSPNGHAVQLHDPSGNETVWVNENALRTSGELPLSNRSLRKLVTLALPRPRGST